MTDLDAGETCTLILFGNFVNIWSVFSGIIQGYNLAGKRADVQSEMYHGEMNCMGVVHRDSKLVVSKIFISMQRLHKALKHNLFKNLSNLVTFFWQTQIQTIKCGLDNTKPKDPKSPWQNG